MYDELVTAEDAAGMLGVGVSRLRELVKSGHIAPITSGKYKLEDVAILANLRKEKVDLPSVAAMALQARATSIKLERLVTQLLTVVGADIPRLELAPDAVRSLYLRVQDALEGPPIFQYNEVFEWARIFFATGEEVFEVAEVHIGSEPWRPFINLSTRMLQEAPERLAGQPAEVRAAYQYLDMARRTLRQAAFFYVCNHDGKRTAQRLFPESTRDAHAELAALGSTIFM